MRRLYRRLTIVGVVMVVGVIAIAQAQLMSRKSETEVAERSADSELPGDDAGAPIKPLGGTDDKPLSPPTGSLSVPKFNGGSSAVRDLATPLGGTGAGENPTGQATGYRAGGYQTTGYTSDSASYAAPDSHGNSNYAADNSYAPPADPNMGGSPAYALNDVPPHDPQSAAPTDPNSNAGNAYDPGGYGATSPYDPTAAGGANYGQYAALENAPANQAAMAEAPVDANAASAGAYAAPNELRTLNDDNEYQPLPAVQPVAATEEAPVENQPAAEPPAEPNYGRYAAALSDQPAPNEATAPAPVENAAAGNAEPPRETGDAYSAIGAGPIGSGAIGVQAGGTAAAPPSQPNYAPSPRPATPAAAPSYLTDAAPSRTTAEPAAAAGAVAAASAATTMMAASETATSDTPGARQLEGAQAPSVTIEKRAPAEIQVGKTAVFETIVRNIGQVGAANVVVLDQIPKGAEYIEASPQPNQLPDGSLIWQLGTLAPGEAKKVTLQLQPKQEGEIGSVAQVLFAAQAGVRTICTKPELVVEHSGPQKVLVGQRVEFAITVANPGTGVATGVLIQEDVPAGLRHPAGTQLEYEIGSLRPQETKRLELTLIADKPGVIRNVMRVQGDGDLAAQHEIELEVVAPSLQVAMAGPTRRYLERQAQYSVSVANPGTAAARNVQLIVHLPKGMKFVTTDHQGQYDPRTHAVYWSLEELPAGENGVVQLTTLPIEAGDQELRVEGRAESGLQHAIAKAVQVEGLAELTFTVADVASPIEVGSDTTYVIRVQNNGSKTDTQVRVAAEFPAGLKPLAGEGPSAATVEGQVVYFEPLAQLTPKSETIFKISARGVAAGDQLVRVQVQSDEVGTPVTKEEHTRVYQDE